MTLPVLVLLALAGAAPALAVRWTEHVDLQRREDIPRALEQEVRLPAGHALTLGEGDDVAAPRTCREYFAARQAGRGPANTYQITQEGFFIERCVPLRLLEQARSATGSHVAGFRFDGRALETLPAAVAGGFGDAYEEATAAGKRWGEVPHTALRSHVLSPTALDVDELDGPGGSAHWVTALRILAWADFDHDGLEDVLLLVSNRARRGTYRSYRHAILTRRGADQPLVLLRME